MIAALQDIRRVSKLGDIAANMVCTCYVPIKYLANHMLSKIADTACRALSLLFSIVLFVKSMLTSSENPIGTSLVYRCVVFVWGVVPKTSVRGAMCLLVFK